MSSDQFSELEDAPVPASKDELLARIATARRVLDDVVAALTEDELGDIRDGAGWSTVDHLSHIAAWERMLVAQASGGSEAEASGIERARFEAMTEQEVNDALYHRLRGLALPDALAEYAAAHGAAVGLVRSMDEAGLQRPYAREDPSGRTVMAAIADNTYRHYLEHRRWIIELVR
jgi:hypothetical protein